MQCYSEKRWLILLFFLNYSFLWAAKAQSKLFILFRRPKNARQSNSSHWFITSFDIFMRNYLLFLTYLGPILTIWTVHPLKKSKNTLDVKSHMLANHGFEEEKVHMDRILGLVSGPVLKFRACSTTVWRNLQKGCNHWIHSMWMTWFPISLLPVLSSIL